MLEDEIAWLSNFVPSEHPDLKDTDNQLLAGHIKLIKTLFTCEGVDKAEYGKCSISFNPFPNKPWLLRVCGASLWKTLWEKEKLLVKSNFSFSHCVFYSFGELSDIFIKLKIVVSKLSKF